MCGQQCENPNQTKHINLTCADAPHDYSAQGAFHPDFMFKRLWLRDLILSVQSLSLLSNMCFIMDLSEALRSTTSPPRPFALIISCNQRQSIEKKMMKWKGNFVLIPSCVRWIQCLPSSTWAHSTLSVVTHSELQSPLFVFFPAIRAGFFWAWRQRGCSLAAFLSAQRSRWRRITEFHAFSTGYCSGDHSGRMHGV